jgi:hypothetical protein
MLVSQAHATMECVVIFHPQTHTILQAFVMLQLHVAHLVEIVMSIIQLTTPDSAAIVLYPVALDQTVST